METQGKVATTKPDFKSLWIHAPSMDLIFIFSFLWVTPLLLYFRSVPATEAFAILLPLTILLSQGHKYSPHILFFSSAAIRSHVKKQRPHILRELTLLIAVPSVIASIAALLFLRGYDLKVFFAPIALLAFLYTAWTYFHFSQQSYGIMRLYRKLHTSQVDPVLDRFEFSMVSFISLGLTALVCTFSNTRLGFYLFFASPLQMPENLLTICLTTCVVCYGVSLYFYRKRQFLNIPIFFAISHYFAITILLCILPIALGLLLISISHWTQAIYLAAVQFNRDSTTTVAIRKKHLTLYLALFLITSSSLYVLYDFIHASLPIVGNFGRAFEFQKYNAWHVALGLLYFGLNTGLNYTHFYLDRFVYRQNPFFNGKIETRSDSQKVARTTR